MRFFSIAQIYQNEHNVLLLFRNLSAFLAQLVEQLTRNEQVAGSSPVEGSKQRLVCCAISFLLSFFCGDISPKENVKSPKNRKDLNSDALWLKGCLF